MKKSSKRKLARLLRYAGATLMAIGFFYILGIAGTSDYESEIHEILHPSSWYWIHSLIGLAIMAIGSFLDNHWRGCFWIIVHIDQYIRDYSKKAGAKNG